MLLKNVPIQRKLMSASLLTSGAVLLLTCIAFFAYELHTFRQTTVRQLSILGEIIATNSTAAIAFDSEKEANEILAALKAEPHIVTAILYDTTGRVFSYYSKEEVNKDLKLTDKWEGYRFSESYLEGFQPVAQGTMKLGTLYLKSDLKAMEERLELYGVITFSVIALASILAFLLSKIFQRSIATPILKLAATASAISEDQDYSVRAEKWGNDELGSLTDAFNHMLLRIQEQNQALSEFNKNLEQKVIERTIELENANKEQKEAEKEVYNKNIELAQALEELQRTEEQLIELNSELERRVAERTNELSASKEELLAKNNELKKTNIDLDNFIYTASHDLKAPISNIEGLTSLLNKRLDGRLTDQDKQLMEMINQSVLKFKNTIADLTEISKVQKNLESEEEDVSVTDTIEDIKGDIREIILQSAVNIEVDLKITNIVFAKKNLRSILYNLMSNAIKYRSPDRQLNLKIKTFLEADYTVMAIEDNGLGISKENLPKLFTMFKRLHTHVEGTGIGLYIVKRIVENKGGLIEVSSELNKGSYFKIYFRNVAKQS